MSFRKKHRRFRLSALALGLFLLACLGFLASKSPSHDRDWKAEYQRLPVVEMTGTRLSIRNIRDFRFTPDDRIARASYLDRDYDMTQLTGVWYGLSHFQDFGLAHSFLSFEFADAPPLVVSVEARMEKGEEYHPWTGLQREYELIFLLATEQDVIGVRTHIRKERVLLYPVDLPPDNLRTLFQRMMERVADIENQAEFYNTLTSNCTSNLADQAEHIPFFNRYFDYRLLLPGYSDELMQELGAINPEQPIEELRQNALLDPARTAIDDPEFSRKIRGSPPPR